jgi:hypothetical protein
MVQILPQIQEQEQPPSFLESLGIGASQALPGAVDQYFSTIAKQKQQRTANETYKRLTGQDLSGLDPESQRAYLIQSLKEGGKTSQQKAKLQENANLLRGLEKERNLPEGSLNNYISDPALAERSTRPTKKTQASQPIDSEQRAIIQKVRSNPDFDNLDELGQYRAMTDAGVSKENAEAESKLRGAQLTRQGNDVEKAYNAQKTFIDDTTSGYRAFEEQTKPKLLQMQSMNPEDLIGAAANVFLEEMGIPLGALEDPSSELYQKLSLDLLKGLPETYGNRILKVEVDNFLKTIPSLMNSGEGRRMIASNMLKLGEMKGVYYNEMRRQQRDYLDSNKPLPRDFEQSIFDQVKPQIDRINNEFVKMAQIKSVPKDTIPFFDPTGEIKFIPKQNVEWATKNGGKRIW